MADREGLLSALRNALDGKDPRKTETKKSGRVLLLLRDAEDEIHRLTIRISEREVALEEHTAEMEGDRWALMRGSLDDGARYLIDADLGVLPRLEIYGETALFGMVRELAAQKRGALTVRLAR